jgi:hypothetical protein
MVFLVGFMSSESKEDIISKYELSRRMFHHIWELNKHEDAKSERILTSVAFLSLTAVTAFGIFVSNKISYIISTLNLSFDLILVSFGAFVVFVSLGTFVFLEASLRGFREGISRIENKKTGSDLKSYQPSSLFYFKQIASEKPEMWSKYFGNNITDLLRKACADNVRETFLISKKTARKVKFYKIGKLFFYLAILSLVVLVIAGCYALR